MLKRLLVGAISGFAATIPMSVVMEGFHRWPYPERDPLPPQQITEELTDRLDVKEKLDEPELTAAVIASHFGFGAGIGSLYGLFERRVPLAAPVKGALWALTVWLTSYLGWVPAVGILKPATKQSKRRNVLMIASHLAWGISAALIFQRLVPDEQKGG